MAKPLLGPADDYLLDAFWALSTCRQMGMGVGPIPWTAVVQFSDRDGLDAEASRIFVQVLRAMDALYMEWVEKNRKK